MRVARSWIVTAERALPTLKLSPDRARVLEREQRALDHVVDVAPGPDLRAVAVDRQVAPGERVLDEGADRAAADLARAEDVERPHGDRGKPELEWYAWAMCSPASFETAYVQRASPTDPIVVTCALVDVERVRAEDLARREVDEALERVLRREPGLEHVVRPDHVDAHRAHRALEHGVHAGDRRAVDDVRRTARRAPRAAPRSSTSASTKREVRMLRELGARERVAVEVVERDDLVRVDEPAGERRADEAGAAGDQDSLVRSGTRRV